MWTFFSAGPATGGELRRVRSVILGFLGSAAATAKLQAAPPAGQKYPAGHARVSSSALESQKAAKSQIRLPN
jgi:hypothetical protein